MKTNKRMMGMGRAREFAVREEVGYWMIREFERNIGVFTNKR